MQYCSVYNQSPIQLPITNTDNSCVIAVLDFLAMDGAVWATLE